MRRTVVLAMAMAVMYEAQAAAGDAGADSREALATAKLVMREVEQCRKRIEALEKEQEELRGQLAALQDQVRVLRARLQATPQQQPAPQAQLPPAQPAPQEAGTGEGFTWTPKTIRIANVLVTIRDVRIAPVEVEAFRGFARTDKSYFVVDYQVSNTSQTQKVDFKTLAGENLPLTRDYAILKDNHGNSYKRISFGIVAKVKGCTESASIHPGKSVGDLIIFEAPVAAATSFVLELPGKSVGGSGLHKVTISRR